MVRCWKSWKSSVMFCQNCGCWVRKDYKYCPSCGITSSNRSNTESTSVRPSVNTFNEFKSKKTKERLGQQQSTGTSKKRKMTDEPVIINVGVATATSGTFKPCRGKNLPLKVTRAASTKLLLEEALKKRVAYDRSFRNDLQYKLCYPDGTEVVYLPGSNEPFTLEKYKDDLGRNYSRITLFLCPLQDENVIQPEVCVIDADFIDSDDDFDLQDSIFDDIEMNYPQNEQGATTAINVDTNTNATQFDASFSEATTACVDTNTTQFDASFSGPTTMCDETSHGDSNENLNHFDSSIPSVTSTEPTVRVISVHRSNIRNDMLNIFSDPSILDERVILDVHFIDSRGQEELGRGSGLVRDMYSLFWKDIYESLMSGENERVPGIRHDFQRPQWEAIGRILLKGYVSCKYFPLTLSKAFFINFLYGEQEISNDILLTSFKNYVSESEKVLIERALDGQIELSESDEFTEFLADFDCKKVVNSNNLNQILTELAHKEIIQKPQYVVDCWKNVIPFFLECFPSRENVDQLYVRLVPTVSRVIASFHAEESNEAERDAMKHLKRFVRGLDKVKLAKFLQFVTGSNIMLTDHIFIVFTRLEGLERRPIAHTCTYTLEIPTTYQCFPEFREEFNSILEANTWEMNIV